MEINSQSGVKVGWLLFLVVLTVGAAYGPQAVAGDIQIEKRDVIKPLRDQQKAAAKPGLTKVLTTRHPRRTDIPDAFLVIMLALIGIVVISRRGVTGKEGALPSKRIDE